MDKSILKAYEQDVQIRVHGLEGGNRTGYKVRAHEIKPGVVYQDANIKVTAFSVEHGSWRNAYGYRFDVAGTSIVISGDTRPSKNVVNACDGCDVLIHEVYSGYGRDLSKESRGMDEVHGGVPYLRRGARGFGDSSESKEAGDNSLRCHGIFH